MQELDFDIDACLERWTEWNAYESDEEPASCCTTYELNDFIYNIIVMNDNVDIDLGSTLLDYESFHGQTLASPLNDPAPDG